MQDWLGVAIGVGVGVAAGVGAAVFVLRRGQQPALPPPKTEPQLPPTTAAKPAETKPASSKSVPPAEAKKPEPKPVTAKPMPDPWSPEEPEDTLVASRSLVMNASILATIEKQMDPSSTSGKSGPTAPAAKSIPAPSAETNAKAEPAPSGRSLLPGAQDTSLVDEEADPDMTGPQPLILVTGVGRTDAGRKRAQNEDRYLALPEHNVFVIADGMGGHAAGEVASQAAVDTIERAFKMGRFDGAPVAERARRGDELVKSVEQANAVVYAKAQSNDEYARMGTTLVSARFTPNRRRVYIASVGDSRCYRVRGDEMVQLTTDHTLGQALGIKGREAGRLTRAVGIEPTVEVDLITDAPHSGDYYLLCSDGLTRMLSDAQVLAILREETDITKASQLLIDRANEAGGRDNITVILIRVDTPHLAGVL